MRAGGLPAWQVNVDDKRQNLSDFNGQVSNGASLSAKWKIRVTPTVLFFDVRGTGIAARLEGISTDFYGAYLYGALDAARQRLKNN